MTYTFLGINDSVRIYGRSFRFINLLDKKLYKFNKCEKCKKNLKITRHIHFRDVNDLFGSRLKKQFIILPVSPNKQYRGIFNPTTPATTAPECKPILSFNCSSGLCRIVKDLTFFKRLSAIL